MKSFKLLLVYTEKSPAIASFALYVTNFCRISPSTTIAKYGPDRLAANKKSLSRNIRRTTK
ncbi:hypothetical protein ABE38_17390 [Brevibacillus agri]|nr:hypothetical protein [Brevibacillus agri]